MPEKLSLENIAAMGSGNPGEFSPPSEVKVGSEKTTEAPNKEAPSKEAPNKESEVDITFGQKQGDDLDFFAKALEAPVKKEDKNGEVKEDFFKDFNLPDDQKELLKQSSIPVRQWIAARLRESQQFQKDLESEKQKPSSNYYEDPEAFVLNPTAKQLAQEYQKTNEILNHWQEQSINAKAGKDVFGVVFDKDGNWHPDTTPYKPGPREETIISTEINKLLNKGARIEEKYESVRSEHQNNHKSTINKIDSVIKDQFSHWSKPEYKDIKSEAEKAIIDRTGISSKNPAFPLLTVMALQLLAFNQVNAQKKAQTDPTESALLEARTKEPGVKKEDVDKIGKFLKGELSAEDM